MLIGTEDTVFPFLIGTVRTSCVSATSIEKRVSIPHRYGKNLYRSYVYRSTTSVSIPHRYGKNPYSFRFIALDHELRFHSS